MERHSASSRVYACNDVTTDNLTRHWSMFLDESSGPLVARL